MTDAEKVVDETAVQKLVHDHGREDQHVDRPEGHHDNRQHNEVHWTDRKGRATMQFTRDEEPSKLEERQKSCDDNEEKDAAATIDDRSSKEEQNFFTSTKDDRSSEEDERENDE